MVSPLLYDEGLPNVATGTTYQFRGFSVQFPDIIKSNLRRLTVAEADANINNWDYGSWTVIRNIGTFANYQVDGTTGVPVNSGGYIFFETDDDVDPITPWRPWWPKGSTVDRARNTYYGLNASGQGNPLDEFQYYAGNFIENESDTYYTSEVRNQVFKESSSDLKKYFIIKLYDNWLRASKSTSNPHGVSLHVPSQTRYISDGTGNSQTYYQAGYTSYSSPGSNRTPYYSGSALVTPICKTDGTSTTSSASYSNTGFYDNFKTPGDLGSKTQSTTLTAWPAIQPLNDFITIYHTVDQYQTSSYVGASQPSVSDSQLPMYMVNNNTMQRMSVSQVLSDFVLPAIQLMTGQASSAGFPTSDNGYSWLPYTISASTSVGGYARVSSDPIFRDYRSNSSLYDDNFAALATVNYQGYSFKWTNQQLLSSYLNNYTTPTAISWVDSISAYYLHRKRQAYSVGNYSAGTDSPFVVLNGSTFEPLSLDTFLSDVLTPLFEWAMVNYSGYRVRYVMSHVRSRANGLGLSVDRQLGSTMVNTQLNGAKGAFNYSDTPNANDTYRLQLFQTGSSTISTSYSLNLVRY